MATDKEKLIFAKIALQNLSDVLNGLSILLKAGGRITVLKSLKRLETRCKEILKELG